MSQCIYTSLKVGEIRLILLHSGRSDDPLTCTFHHYVLSPRNTSSKYIAVSYCWGNEALTHPIVVNGHPSHITENLASAMYHIRTNTKGNYAALWVDAICINQADLAEKSLQIGRMRLIYESAVAVICWLGHEVGHMRTACGKLTELFALLPTGAFEMKPSMSLLIKYTPIIHSHLSEQDWLALSRFFTDPWWYRVW